MYFILAFFILISRVVSGAPVPFPEHALVMMDFAIGMFETLQVYNMTAKHKLEVRVGINVGKFLL